MNHKKQNSKAMLLSAMLLSTSLFFSGCAGDPGTSDNSVRIAFFPNVTHTQALYGKSTGRFDDAFGDDVSVQWLEFNAGPSEIEAMFAGEVDIGYIGPIPAINAFIKSKGDVVVIAGAADGGSVLVTRPGLELNSVSELSGLKVAIPQLGNTQHLLLLNLLQENELETRTNGGTVEIAASSNADIMTLLDQGNVDAALVPEPWGSRMVHEIGANLLLDETQIWRNGDYPVSLVIVNKDFMEKHPDLVQTFLNTHFSITEEINADLDSAKQILNQELENLTQKSLSPNVLDDAFSRISVTTDIKQDVMEAYADILAEGGFTSENPNLDGLIHMEILEQAKGEH